MTENEYNDQRWMFNFYQKINKETNTFFGNPTLTTNQHLIHHLTHELMNQFPVATAAKSVGEECWFTQELFNILQHIDEFILFIFFIFLLSCCT